MLNIFSKAFWNKFW